MNILAQIQPHFTQSEPKPFKVKQDFEDKMFDYAIRHIRRYEIFNNDCTFEEFNETLRVEKGGWIELTKASVVDMAMAYVEGEMAYIVNEYFSHQEEPTMAKEYNFPFEIHDYDHYIDSFEYSNPYIHGEVKKLKEMVDYIDEKYSSLLGSYYFN